MTTIVYIFGICCFAKSLEFWIQKSVRNLFAQYNDVIESKQSHPLPTLHSTSAYNPCVNEILSMVKMISDCLVIWVSMQQQYISPLTQFSQSVFRVSLLYPILTLLCIFPPIEESIIRDLFILSCEKNINISKIPIHRFIATTLISCGQRMANNNDFFNNYFLLT